MQYRERIDNSHTTDLVPTALEFLEVTLKANWRLSGRSLLQLDEGSYAWINRETVE